ncbi:bifunctional 2-polyprenyl-6-hydroxyphenol methylase/3-demethylubiquinol 3-O-methyltransferase UbiG [Alphaproteobacteria bacterium LSUCC0684]
MSPEIRGNSPTAETIDAREIRHFDNLSASWWDRRGPFAALHRMTPARVRYIRQHASRLLGQDRGAGLKGLDILDIGCGGGLLAEPLCRLGARVTGIDASAEAINAAKAHADTAGLNITYRAISSEDLVLEMRKKRRRFDIVIASEVIEHVADRQQFLKVMAGFAHTNGVSMAVLTTINRSLMGVALGKYAAEYLLNLAPKGTHDPQKFVRPDELRAEAARAGIDLDDITGMRPTLFGDFALDGPPAINYAAAGLIRP